MSSCRVAWHSGIACSLSELVGVHSLQVLKLFDPFLFKGTVDWRRPFLFSDLVSSNFVDRLMETSLCKFLEEQKLDRLYDISGANFHTWLLVK